MKKILLPLLLFLIAALDSNAQKWMMPANGAKLTYGNLQTKLLVTYLASPRSYNTKRYYENGALMADEQWLDSLHHGNARYYLPNGSLSKEITFNKNFIKAYTAYVNGVVYTKISADRTEVVNKGRRLNLAFDKYYEVNYDGYVQVFTRRQVIDFLSNVMMPEEVTELMAAKFDASMKNLPAGSDLLGCTAGTSGFNDHGVDLASFNASSQSKNNRPAGGIAAVGSSSQMQVGTLINDAQGQCSGGGSGGGRPGSTSGVRPTYSSQEQAARQKAQAMISNCQSQTSADKKNQMIGIDSKDVQTGIGYAAGAASAAIRFTKMAGTYMVQSASTEIQLAEILAEAGIPQSAGFVAEAGEVMVAAATTPVAEVVAAGAAGYSLGTLLNKAFAEKLIQNSGAMAKATTSEYEAEQTKLAADAQKKKEAQDAAAKKAADAQGASPTPGANPPAGNTPPGGTPAKDNAQGTPPATTDPAPTTPPTKAPGVSTPNPEATDPCQAMQNFFNQCERSAWKEYRCAEFVRMINGCNGDVTVINPAPDGSELAAVGCKSGNASAVARALDCKKKGMIQLTTPEGQGCGHGQPALNKGMLPDRNGNVTDPTRNPMGALFQNRNVGQLNAASLQTRLASAKPLLVVFYDPSCNSCQQHLNTVLGSDMTSSLQGMDIAVVDVSENPSLATKYNISIVPTSFRSTNGSLGQRAEGAMSAADLKSYLRK
jgi:hypothetical protein